RCFGTVTCRVAAGARRNVVARLVNWAALATGELVFWIGTGINDVPVIVKSRKVTRYQGTATSCLERAARSTHAAVRKASRAIAKEWSHARCRWSVVSAGCCVR